MASTFGLPLGDGALLSGRPLVRFQSDAQMNSRNVDALEIGDTDGSPIEVRIPLICSRGSKQSCKDSCHNDP